MNRPQAKILHCLRRRECYRLEWLRRYSCPSSRASSPSSRLSLVPGTMCDNRLWQGMLPVFAQGNVLTAEVRLWEAADRSSMRELITRSISNECGQDRNLPVDLLGFSMGGYLALDLYCRKLEHDNDKSQPTIRSIIIICSSARGLGPRERVKRKHMLDLMARHNYAGISPSRIARFVKPGLVDDARVGGLIAAMDKDLGKEVLLAQFSSTLDRENLMDRLPQIRIPVLIVGSEGDQMVDANDLYLMHERIKGSKLVMFKDAGHMIPLEAPERLASIVLDFINGL
ncbi:Alpha/Beta hydrolase protein [Lipomyces kononenkoae]|uniref:Alpha/Beta hydrolase protein n=1 Tax=Lipomyces kononenkoae TaxID=34357 RepID=A0ACC3T223_LIPKO